MINFKTKFSNNSEECRSGFQPEADPPLAETGALGNNMYYIYVLWSSNLSKRYVGSTVNVEKRLVEHNRGGNKFTKGGIPWIKVYQEEYSTKTEAVKREKYLKSGQGRAWLDKQLPNFRRGAGVVFSQRLIRLWRKRVL